jgi:hypothetical protein
LDLLLTPTVTLSTDVAGLASGTGTPSATEVIESSASNCQPGKLDFISPKAGDTLDTGQGAIELRGVVTIPSNFGYYKYEYAPANSQNWSTIQANDKIRCPDKSCQLATPPASQQATEDPTILGNWDLSQLTAGDYFLRLIATDNTGKALPACQIPIHITGPTPSPGS